VIEPLAGKAGEGRRRKDGHQGCLSELRELHGKESLWDTAGLQSWVRVFETEEFDLRCKSEEVVKKRR
jgi:hypothetical protein